MEIVEWLLRSPVPTQVVVIAYSFQEHADWNKEVQGWYQSEPTAHMRPASHA
ncbi:hypothetical protein [Alitabrizicola rongguiensis]|uniref:hypothetical protein n=1 Tax=Alitabrizicola rongguiensis TaxID=2909234 RepID=UPI001F3809D7|nr:hypothetical protein [Tabrizicola rongguiensis]